MDKLIDISLVLSPALPTWPGSQKFQLDSICRLAKGDSCNESSYSANIHTGTHIDAPWHFLDEGKKTDALELQHLIGPTLVIHLQNVNEITAHHLESSPVNKDTKRLLIRTDNSRLWAKGVNEFEENFVALTAGAAEWLAKTDIRLVGIDYLSIQLFKDNNRTHEVLLASEIIILEGLDLHKVEPGYYELLCLPLAIQGAEGAPARAVLRKLPRQGDSL